MVETVDKQTEIVWCNHLKVTPRPVVMSKVPHVYIHDKCYLAVEEGKIMLICSHCWLKAVNLPMF